MDFDSRHYLIALAGVLIPVLIHLLTRDRIRRVEFSTLRFFVRTSSRVLRRKRFREAILLVLRALACAMLAIAFAQPYLTEAGEKKDLATIEADTARVVVADVSHSTTRAGGTDAVRRLAAAAVADLADGPDAAAVVAFAGTADVRAPLSKDLAPARQAARELAAGDAPTNIPQALRAANDELKHARARRRQIVLISDLQRTGWQGLNEDLKLAPGVELLIEPLVRDRPADHLAVLGASFAETTVLDREPVPISVQVVNYAARARQGVTVQLDLAGRRQSHKLAIRPGRTASATFRHVFETAGDHRGTITLLDEAGSGADVFYGSTRVIPKIKVVLIDGAGAPGQPSEAAFYLQAAMAPAPNVASPFACVTRPAGQITPGELGKARVAVLVNVASAAAPVRRALRDLLGRGGGILLLPGDRVEPEAFAESFADVAPCRLRRVRTGRLMRFGGVGAALAKIDYEHPIFEIFSHPRHGDLSLPRFRRYWEVTDSQHARVLAKFDDNRPAVLARKIDAGVSMMLASCPQDDWTNFPKRTTFLPYVWQTLKYLAARTEQRTAWRVGEPLSVPADHELLAPGGRTLPAGTHLAETPGFYVLTDAAGQETLTLAVNRSPAESDPAAVAAEEIAAAVVQPAIDEPTGAAGGESAKRANRPADDPHLWWWVLLAMTVLLVGELLLGNKTLRH